MVQLYAEEAKEAWATYQDVLGVDSFMTSTAAHAADNLFDAYRSGDRDQVCTLHGLLHDFFIDVCFFVCGWVGVSPSPPPPPPLFPPNVPAFPSLAPTPS